VLAGLLALFLFGLAGFPPMAGFAAKYYIFYAALVSGHPELLIIGVLASILGMYYYLRPIATMFMEREVTVPATPSRISGPLPTDGRRVSGKLSTSSTGGTATAVAAKPATIPQTKAAALVEDDPAEEKVPTAWPTKVALTLALLGALAMGTVLPLWLIQLAQQAAHFM
jgi:NADH-quinone oxidoreductase subunit N